LPEIGRLTEPWLQAVSPIQIIDWMEGRALSRPIIIILNEMEGDGRKHPVHALVYERHNTPVIVFLTVCTKNREAILANDSAHRLLRAAGLALRAEDWVCTR
jgi:hypothetical protein